MKVTLEGSLKEDVVETSTTTDTVEDKTTIRLRPGAPPSRELTKMRLIIDLSAFFDVPLTEGRRWVEETELELSAFYGETTSPFMEE